MSDDRLDLSALDPTQDNERWESLIAAIRERAAPELALRSERSVIGVLGYWAWPVLAAASLIALLSGGALALLRPTPVYAGVVEALGLSEPVAVWLQQNAVTTDDLLIALGGDRE